MHFSALGVLFAQVDQQRALIHTQSRNFWQQLPETTPNLRSA